MKALLWIGLLFSLVILAIGGSWLSLGHWMTATVRAAGPPPVIPPGRENVVMTFLGPVMKNGFAGLSVSNISLEKSEIRLQLDAKKDSSTKATNECIFPDWARAPGMLVIVPDRAPGPQCPANTACGMEREKDLVLVWAACTSENAEAKAAREWISALAQRDHSGIWEMPRDALDDPKAKEAGLLTPIVLATGREKGFVAQVLLLASLVITGLTALVLRWRMGRSASQANAGSVDEGWKFRWGIICALVIVGIGLRIHAAATLPRDHDEIFNGVYTQKILCEDHDSWVHPPLFRAVNKAWVDTTGFTANDAIWKLRLPSLVFSILALCFLALTFGAASLPAYATIPLALVAMSPAAIEDSILVRPYGLAMFGATLCLIAISSRDLLEEKSEDWFCWFVALVALGLTIWTDLVTSLLVGSFVLVRWLAPRSFSKKTTVWGRAFTASSIAAWAVPFALGLPGSVEASKSLQWPFRTAAESKSAFDQVSSSLWSMFGRFGFAHDPGLFLGLVAIAMAAILIVYAIQWTRSSTAIGMGLVLVMLALVSHRLGLRTRNVIFLPVAFTFVTSLVIARAPLETMKETVRRWQTRWSSRR